MYWVIGILALLVVIGIAAYNSLVVSKNRVENAWSQIDVQLKRRTDLVPNLVETVKGYAAHEHDTFEMVTKARAQMVSAGGVAEQAQANNQMTQALKSLFAVAEAYPELKANQNFLMLQEELAGIENKIAYARQFYNDSVLRFNASIQSFPTSIFARSMGFTEKKYFETPEAEREVPKVKF
ncbi:MAG: LemA family protein [Bacillota bacterium]